MKTQTLLVLCIAISMWCSSGCEDREQQVVSTFLGEFSKIEQRADFCLTRKKRVRPFEATSSDIYYGPDFILDHEPGLELWCFLNHSNINAHNPDLTFEWMNYNFKPLVFMVKKDSPNKRISALRFTLLNMSPPKQASPTLGKSDDKLVFDELGNERWKVVHVTEHECLFSKINASLYRFHFPDALPDMSKKPYSLYWLKEIGVVFEQWGNGENIYKYTPPTPGCNIDSASLSESMATLIGHLRREGSFPYVDQLEDTFFNSSQSNE